MNKKTKREIQRESDWKFVLSDEKGRRVLAEIVEASGTLKHNLNSEVILLAKAEGSRIVGLEVLNTILQYKPSAFTKILEENARMSARQKEELIAEQKKNDELGVYADENKEEKDL
jgi:hypothetical protein